MSSKNQKAVNCYDLRNESGGKETGHEGQPKKIDCNKYNDDKILEKLQKESEAELERARQVLKKTETSFKYVRRPCPDRPNMDQVQPPPAATPCKSNMQNESRDAIKSLARVPVPKDSGLRERSCGKDTSVSRIPAPQGKTRPKDLPKKPKLSPEEITALLDQEAQDVKNAWFLTTESKEHHKKPCPKQQRAMEAVRALMEPEKEEPPPPPPPPKDPLPFFDPEPDDISPEIAANMMYTQERGIKMISCPEETVRHLFAKQLGEEENEAAKKKEEREPPDSAEVDHAAEADDSAYTRKMGSKGSKSKSAEKTGSLEKKKVDVVLEEKETKCVNKIQLRGNCAPWFPGYYMAFPDQPSVQLAKSPSMVFQKAWLAANPSCMPLDDIYLVE